MAELIGSGWREVGNGRRGGVDGEIGSGRQGEIESGAGDWEWARLGGVGNGQWADWEWNGGGMGLGAGRRFGVCSDWKQ